MTAAFTWRASRSARSWRGWKTCRSMKTRSSCRCRIRASARPTRWPIRLGVPSVEGLIRNRYSGRTFIEGVDSGRARRPSKYTPLREVLEGKRVLLVEDSIVRSTTMRVLISQIREVGLAREIHVRVACPPIIAPCFYGIDMSTISELFAPRFVHEDQPPEAIFAEMARELGADSLRYLPIESIARALDRPASDLCRACVTGRYPTPHGQKLYQIALANAQSSARGNGLGGTDMQPR